MNINNSINEILYYTKYPYYNNHQLISYNILYNCIEFLLETNNYIVIFTRNNKYVNLYNIKDHFKLTNKVIIIIIICKYIKYADNNNIYYVEEQYILYQIMKILYYFNIYLYDNDDVIMIY